MTDEERERIKEAVLESIEQSAEVYGLSRSAGRVYGILLFSGEPLSIPELVEETGYAKSTISTVTRKLSRLGLVRRLSSEGGGRRVQFSPETDLWFILQDVSQQYAYREIQMTRRTLERALEDLDDVDGRQSLPERERLEELAETYEQLQTLLERLMDHSLDELIEALEQYEAQS